VKVDGFSADDVGVNGVRVDDVIEDGAGVHDARVNVWEQMA